VKAQRLAALRPHERDMRSKGIPLQGAGLIFPVADDDIVIDPIEIPRHWPQIIGVDFGISTQHPFSAANLGVGPRHGHVKYLTARVPDDRTTCRPRTCRRDQALGRLEAGLVAA
jgi:hypothetical protein